MRVAIYAWKPSGRTMHIAQAMHKGFTKHGIKSRIVRDRKDIQGDLAVAYGWNHEPIFKRFQKEGLNYIYFDLGYWNRRPSKHAREGFHRVAVNSWCSSEYLPENAPCDRFNRLKIDLKPLTLNEDGHVLVTGMSAKAAGTHGLRPGQWERDTIGILRQYTNRTITLRQKPTKRNPNIQTIEDALNSSYMLITHHSNTAVDALVNGVPYYCKKGVARRLSVNKVDANIMENPPIVDDHERLKLVNSIAYCQWTPEEMRTGELWEYLKNNVSVFA